MNSSLSFEQEDKELSHFLSFTLLTLKKALYLSVNVFSMKVLIGDTIFLCLLLETGLPFYMVIQARLRSTRLQGKGSTFISQLS